jgi:hypothetical protein
MEFKEINEIIEWFEKLLGVNGLKFKYTICHYDTDGLDKFDFEREILTRKVLYYDTTNNVLSTHSPYGSHWENRKDVVKIKTTENFRWCIKGEDFLSCYKPCNITYEDYYGNSKLLMCCNEKRVNALYNLIRAFS